MALSGGACRAVLSSITECQVVSVEEMRARVEGEIRVLSDDDECSRIRCHMCAPGDRGVTHRQRSPTGSDTCKAGHMDQPGTGELAN